MIALVAAAVIGMAAPGFARQLDKGWWVVVGSFPTEPAERMKSDFDRINAAVAPCGQKTFNDFSGKFRGFAPGFNVFVIGAFASRAEADRIALAVRKCIPGAYVKYGDYAGE
jgi:hypothetical protein